MIKCGILGLCTFRSAGAHLDCQGRPILLVFACLTLLLRLQLLAPARRTSTNSLATRLAKPKDAELLPLHASQGPRRG